jgi:hypothetical protein
MQTAKCLDEKPRLVQNTGGIATQREAYLKGKRTGLDTPVDDPDVQGNGGVMN